MENMICQVQNQDIKTKALIQLTILKKLNMEDLPNIKQKHSFHLTIKNTHATNSHFISKLNPNYPPELILALKKQEYN